MERSRNQSKKVQNPHHGFADNMILSLILNLVSKTIASSINFIESAEDMWNELNKDILKEMDHEFFKLKKWASMSQDTSSVSEYHTKLKGTWDELSNYRLVPDWSCGSYKIVVSTTRANLAIYNGIEWVFCSNQRANFAHGSITWFEQSVFLIL